MYPYLLLVPCPFPPAQEENMEVTNGTVFKTTRFRSRVALRWTDHALRVTMAVIVLFCLITRQLAAQVDTVIHLPEVDILATPAPPDVVGERGDSWSKGDLAEYQYEGVSALLRQQTGTFIKSYGVGGIATLSVRGSNAAQTLVTWNGVQLQHPMLGLPDLSLIPVAAFDQAQLSYGGNTAFEGSGAIGGRLALSNDRQLPEKFSAELYTNAGSFGLWDHGGTIAWGNGSVGLRTRIVHTRSDNDFKYSIRPDLPEKTLQNAAFKQTAIVQDVTWKRRDDEVFSAHVWWQDTYREVPPTTVQNASLANQQDANLRLTADWIRQFHTVKLAAKAAYLRDVIDYRNPAILVEAYSKASTAMGLAEASWSIDPSYVLTGGLSHYFMSGDIDAYSTRETQNRTSLYASFIYRRTGLSFQFNLREELVDGDFAPFVLAAGANWSPYTWLEVKGKVSKDYRMPALNELYWMPGGDPKLKPERGWSQEIGLAFTVPAGRSVIKYQLTGFNRMIKDWILWSIEEGETWWGANNITRVHSRGVEQRLSAERDYGNVHLDLELGYDFVLSTNEVALESPEIAAGEQLIYVPKHRAFGSIALRWNALKLAYHHNVTSKVRTDRDETIDGYHIGDINASYQFEVNSFTITPFIQCNNIWNADYRVIQYRPMPGRNFKFGLSFKFN